VYHVGYFCLLFLLKNCFFFFNYHLLEIVSVCFFSVFYLFSDILFIYFQLPRPFDVEPTRKNVLEWAMNEGEITNAQETNVVRVDPLVRALQRFDVFVKDGPSNEKPAQRLARFKKTEYQFFK
jgi:hypothetical protein